MKIKSVIFDLDGLLIDSQCLHYEAACAAFAEKGHVMTKEDWHNFIHGHMEYEEYIKVKNLSLLPKKIHARKREIYNQLIKNRLTLKTGARDLVDLLQGSFDLAVASHSNIDSVKFCIDKFNFTSTFKHVISDQVLSKRKPHPEVFLRAAKLMKVHPEDCLVFEDSLQGLQAAKSAGMKCIICPDDSFPVNKELYRDADKIIDRLDEVDLEMISNL